MKAELWVLLAGNLTIVSLFIYFALLVFPGKELSEETKRRPRSFISNAMFREFWYFMMEPFKVKLIKWGIGPNALTTAGLVFSMFAAAAFVYGYFGFAGWCIIFAATCDVYDGMLARARRVSLKSGAFLDSTFDRVGESAMFCGLLWFFRDDPVWFFIVFLGLSASQIGSYCRARAEGLGFNKEGSRGTFQRAERMIIFSIGMTISPLADLYLPIGHTAKATLIIIAIGSFQTALTRSIGIYKEMRLTEK